MAAIDQLYRYAAPSTLAPTPGGATLSLVGETGRAPEEAAFLDARALRPDVTARGLRGVSEIVGSRFYVPPSMLARILREADPVVTVSPGAVRVEGFSACCSAYARLDIADDGLEVAARRNGTTNVDFGAELRGALAGVTRDTALDLKVGAGGVAVARDGAEIVEKKVALPVRWVRGMGEVQVAQAGMDRAFGLTRVAMQRLLRALPRGKTDHLQYLTVAGGQARLALRETPGAVPLRGGHRLRVLDTMATLCEGAEVWVNRATGASAWALDLPGQRFWLVLNAEPWRGFSGDGGLLSRIATSDGSAAAAVRAQLNWQDRIEVEGLCAATGLDPHTVEGALAELAATGLVGYDLARGGYFHRVLPFDMERIGALNPRLVAARKLLDAGAVTLDNRGGQVRSGEVVHRVVQEEDGWRCTCPWFARNGTQRGPCKHALAVEMALDGTTT